MWKIKKIDKDIFICPNCGAEVEQRTPFCPYCGKNNHVVEMNLFDTSQKIIEQVNCGELPPLSIPNVEQNEFGLQKIK